MVALRGKVWRAVAAAVVVATGLAVVWGVLAGWLISMGETLTRQRDVQEDILVAIDGTVVIGANSRALVDDVPISRRTLDGKSFPVDYEYWLTPAWLEAHNYPPGVVQLPLDWQWGGRIGGFTDGRNPPAAWYVVRDDELPGHCYLAGYDAFSKLSVGYIGRAGFRSNVPPREEHFEFPNIYEKHMQPFLASTQYFQSYGVVRQHSVARSKEIQPPQWFIFLAETDRIWEIDLRQRTLKVAFEVPKLVSINGYLRTLKSTPLNQTVEKPTTPATTTNADGETKNGKEPEYATVISARTDDKIVLHTPLAPRKEFALPPNVPNNSIQVYWIAPDQLLLNCDGGAWSDGPVRRLLWIDPTGKVQREEEVKLTGWRSDSPRATAWAAAGVVPVAIVWVIGLLVGAPLYMLQNYKAASYTDAVNQAISISWPALIIVLLVAAVLTWVTMRLQRKYRRSHTNVWATFVFLLGVPGFLAYLVEKGRTKLEACPQCGEIVPRDRETCAACNTEFAPPAHVPTEILA
jgi:hypothetical protein